MKTTGIMRAERIVSVAAVWLCEEQKVMLLQDTKLRLFMSRLSINVQSGHALKARVTMLISLQLRWRQSLDMIGIRKK